MLRGKKLITCAIAQMKPLLGDVRKNLDKHLDYIEKAKQQQANVIAFPELSLTGYNLQDLSYDVALTINSREIQQLVQKSSDIDIIFSFVEEDERHSFYISSIYASMGKILHIHRKVYLPTYGLFDEARYFDAGNRIQAFSTEDARIGMLICEDAWHPSTAYILSTDGAHVIYVVAASPGRGPIDGQIQSNLWWQTTIRSYAQLHGVYVVYVNRVGYEDGLSFAGGSSVYDSEGNLVLQAPNLDEGLFMANIDLRKIRRSRIANPLKRNEKLDLTIKELQRISAKTNEQLITPSLGGQRDEK
ncbi:hypothetical protein BHU72_09255 [Desulfuribacillus stibiiarsenatis]|uniref:CN hydrolase domain-containing protein n=1 Tax=Desulfuribacillus stibiiarsenatis TaxID=1390249 RepID=A0A1E5L2T3_9FIRM|nr:nitrilase-related carbon-nitrogen hydrolase [Desulfuribacillus stibiiarsenatis]OEH84396.1 hypothetical protein BHU72_09255 [Desulfuribacillus stibiiarsenatis]